MTALDAFHWIPVSRKMQNLGRKRSIIIKPGTTYSENGVIRACKNGLHASRTLQQVMHHAYCTVSNEGYLCKVKVWGKIDVRSNKLAAQHRHVVGMIRLTHNDSKSSHLQLEAKRVIKAQLQLLGWA